MASDIYSGDESWAINTFDTDRHYTVAKLTLSKKNNNKFLHTDTFCGGRHGRGDINWSARKAASVHSVLVKCCQRTAALTSDDVPKAAIGRRLVVGRKALRSTDMSAPLEERVQTFLTSLTHNPDYAGFDTGTLGGVGLVSASQETQSVRYAFTVVPTLCNSGGTLHGGAATSLFDTLTTSALLTIARAGHWDTLGVSRTLAVTFLRPIPIGAKVSVDCGVVAAGKNLANLTGAMRTADGKVCITCTHDKVAVAKPKL